jgi:hypothetical protein
LIIAGPRGRGAVQGGVSRQRLEQPRRHRPLPGAHRPARRRLTGVSLFALRRKDRTPWHR